MPPCTTGTFAG